MATKIQARRDTSTNWAAQFPTLASGEFAFVTDTDKLKIGDGTTEWNSLGYFSGGGGGWATTGLTNLTGDASISGYSEAYGLNFEQMKHFSVCSYGNASICTNSSVNIYANYRVTIHASTENIEISSYALTCLNGYSVSIYASSGSASVCALGGDINLYVENTNSIVVGDLLTSTSDYVLAVSTTTGGNVSMRDISTLTSDISLKENIEVIGECTLDRLTRLEPISFNWKKEFSAIGDSVYGVIAQEVEKEFPNLVKETKNGNDTVKAIKYQEWTPILIKSIKELSEEVNKLKDQINN